MSRPDVSVTAAQLAAVMLAAADVFRQAAAQPLESTRKSDGSIVTRVDALVNEWLHAHLRALAPAAAWLSEESVQDPARLQSDWAWVVDPVDGTKELAAGLRESTISVGLVEHGRVRAGGVINPFTGLAAVSGTDGSWWQSAEPVEPAEQPAGRVSVSRTETADGRLVAMRDLFPPMVSVGSVAYKLLRVARGIDRMTVSVQPKSEWDLCGGVALIERQGGVVVRLDGQPLIFNQADPLIPLGMLAGQDREVRTVLRGIRERLGHTEVLK